MILAWVVEAELQSSASSATSKLIINLRQLVLCCLAVKDKPTPFLQVVALLASFQPTELSYALQFVGVLCFGYILASFDIGIYLLFGFDRILVIETLVLPKRAENSL